MKDKKCVEALLASLKAQMTTPEELQIIENCEVKLIGKIIDDSGEEWRDIPGYEGLYQVSNLLRVKSLRWQGGRIMKPKINKYGYPCLNLFKEGKKYFFGVHILAARAFIPNPENKPVVHHINSNPTTCTVDELEWATYSENESHAYRAGRKHGIEGSKNHFSKLTENQVKYIRKNYKPFDEEFGGKTLAMKFKVSTSAISNIVCDKCYKNVEHRNAKKTGRKGAESPSSKLTEDDVRFIRRVYKPRSKEFGMSALARKYKISKNSIYYLIIGKTYKDVK